jgi:hypothetical protein
MAMGALPKKELKRMIDTDLIASIQKAALIQ